MAMAMPTSMMLWIIAQPTIFQLKKRITAIEKYQGQQPYSTERFNWDRWGNLISKSILNETKEVIAETIGEYDDRGNLLSESLRGNLTGAGSDVFLKTAATLQMDLTLYCVRNGLTEK